MIRYVEINDRYDRHGFILSDRRYNKVIIA